ncbi:MAG: DUF89 family protein [Oscillospiraceae bacterium]|nr:DUF89 family protein [Oscillospiraceae bacterium]MBQ8797008.1 DUF89 family protein [Oscillospiraceae bacterium]
MSIGMNSICFACRMNNIIDKVGPLGSEAQLTVFLKKWMEMASKYDESIDSARCGYYTNCLVKEIYGIDPADEMKKDREESNRFVVERLDHIRTRVEAAADPIYAGLQYAILGNYLDFAALADKVSYSELDEMLNKAKDIQLPADTVTQFTTDLHKGKKLLILTDNAGEIGFDRVLAQVLKKAYPHLQITFCVRGLPVANDATREDAAAVGIEFPVIDSGNAVGGTALEILSDEAKQAMEGADVILAKGMGNTESMFGCGYNVYYAFLVKCQRFMEVFNAPMMQAMFIKEDQ